MAYRIFTVNEKEVNNGALVSSFRLSNGKFIRAIVIGNNGENERAGVIPVSGLSSSDGLVRSVDIGETRSGKIKFINSENGKIETSWTIVVCVPSFFRSKNIYTGKMCSGKEKNIEDSVSFRGKKFLPFPGRILSRSFFKTNNGLLRENIVAMIPDGSVFHMGFDGDKTCQNNHVNFVCRDGFVSISNQDNGF